MKKSSKFIVLGMVVVSLGGVLTPFVSVRASEIGMRGDWEGKNRDFDVATPSVEQLKELGLTETEIKVYLTSGKTGISLYDGAAFDKEGHLITNVERGRLSWAVKAIRAAYNRAPRNVKRLIWQYTSLEGILGFIEHWTGTIENGIYHACKRVGMPNWAAWTVAKGLTMLI